MFVCVYIYMMHIVTLYTVCIISIHQMIAVKPNESPHEEPAQRDLILADDEDGPCPWIAFDGGIWRVLHFGTTIH